jgi:hypothetical protein
VHCDKCGNENPENNRFCGQCGSALLRRDAVKDVPPGPVLNSFHSDVERQRSELREIRQQTGSEPSPAESEPLSKIATAPANFGPAISATAVREPVVRDSSVREPAKEWFSPARGAARAEAPITGPSFLGLSDPETAEDSELAYLYEDDVHPGHARQWIAALIAIAFAGFIVYEWHQNPEWQSNIVGRAQQVWQQRKAAPAAANPPQVQTSASPPAQAAPSSAPAAATVAGAAGPAQNQDQRPEKNTGVQTGAGPVEKQQSDDAAKQQVEPNPSAEKNEEANFSPEESPALVRSGGPDNALVTKADGYLYGHGGVPKNCDQALVYLHTAADRGNTTALSKLGGLYATGNCVPLDRARAYNWFTKARAAGDHNVWIERNMSMLWNAMTPEEKARAR